MGIDTFFVCLGISSIILALATARAAPGLMAMIERIAMRDARPAARPAPPPDRPPGDPPWGRRG